jgi:serine/threonine protein kinase/tetratricopeptide (TPR) repeat protein
LDEVDPQAPTRTIPSSPSGPRTGDRVGRYVIEREIGAGGMGVVVEARDPELQRQVALKLVRPDAGDRAYTARLVREARAMAKLEHPNVVRVYDSGEEGGEVFVAMELVVGRSLGAWLRAVRRPWRDVLALFVDAGRGLAAAHAAGMVHRDFKPDNVLVRDSDGSVAVTDFGLAVPADREHHGAGAAVVTPISGDDPTIKGGGPSSDLPTPQGSTFTLTRTGVAVGTPPYMAPEQHRGTDVDARADIFSFCASLYEGVYGERPFVVDNAHRHDPDAWSEAIARGPRPPPANRRVPASLRRIVIRGLAADASDRWPTMDALLVALRSVLSRRRRIVLISVSPAIVALVVSALLIARRAPIDRCAEDAARIENVWGAFDRQRVDRALRATGAAYASVASERATASLDRWATAWREAVASACRDSERGALAASDWRGIAACLDDALADARTRVGILAAGGKSVDNAEEVATLPPPQTCVRGGAEAPPADSRLALEVLAAQEEARAIDSLHVAGDYRAAAPRARALLARVRAYGWRPLIDRVAAQLVDLDLAVDESLEEAEPLAREVAQSASARGVDRLAATQWGILLDLATETRRLDGLDYLASFARAAATRARDTALEVRIEATVGEAYVAAGRVEDGRSACTSALGRAERLGAAGADARRRALECLETVAQSSNRADDAVEIEERILEENVREFGPRHPRVLQELRNLAIVILDVGRVRDALVLRLCAHDLTLERYGPGSLNAARSWAGLAHNWQQLGDERRARDALERATQIASTVSAPGQQGYDDIMRVRADMLTRFGDTDGAIEAIRGVAEAIARDHPGTPDELGIVGEYAYALAHANRCADSVAAVERSLAHLSSLPKTDTIVLEQMRAQCLVQLGRPADAARNLSLAWAAIDPSQLAAPDRGGIEAQLAEAFERSGDHARAVEYARLARKDLENDPTQTENIDVVTRILGHSSSGHE